MELSLSDNPYRTMQALNAPSLLRASVLSGGLSKHQVPRNSRWQQLAGGLEPDPLHGYRHSLSFAQLEGIQVVEKTSPSTPIEPPKIEDFIIVSVVLLVVFWIGNYVVPDLIYKKLSGPEAEKQKGDVDDRQRILDGLFGRNDESSDLAARSEEVSGSKDDGTVRGGRGFGKASKQASKNRKELE